jgi:hypothetical protein
MLDGPSLIVPTITQLDEQCVGVPTDGVVRPQVTLQTIASRLVSQKADHLLNAVSKLSGDLVKVRLGILNYIMQPRRSDDLIHVSRVYMRVIVFANIVSDILEMVANGETAVFLLSVTLQSKGPGSGVFYLCVQFYLKAHLRPP